MRPPSHPFIHPLFPRFPPLPLCPPPPFSSCDGLKLHSGDSHRFPLLTSLLAHPSPVPTMLSDYSVFPKPGPARPFPALIGPFLHPYSVPWLQRRKKKPNFTPTLWRAKTVAGSGHACKQACALDRHSGWRKNPCGGRSIPGHYSYFGDGGAADRYLFPVEQPGQTAV